MLTVEEALARIIACVSPSSPQSSPLADCLHATLAEDLTTPHDSPPFDKSMMDGFAVRAENGAADDRRVFRVLETITAGTLPSAFIQDGTSSRIMTGAPMPEGADCVVPIENVVFDEREPQVVQISCDEMAAEQNVLRKGSVAKTGEPLLSRGTAIQPQHIAVLAEFGVAKVPVHSNPSVAVLATGDELLSVDQPLTPGKIRNSNEPMLVSQILRAHARPVPLGVAKDTPEDLGLKIRQGLKCDFLILSGGVSAGTMDLVPSQLAAAGVTQVFHKIQMKPGKPLWFGELQTDSHRCWVFGLPGNPVSGMVCFELFVRTALRQFCGYRSPGPDYNQAVLTKPVAVRGDRPTYFPCHVVQTDSGLTTAPVMWGGSADLRATADANGMCHLVPSAAGYQVGDIVPTVLWS